MLCPFLILPFLSFSILFYLNTHTHTHTHTHERERERERERESACARARVHKKEREKRKRGDVEFENAEERGQDGLYNISLSQSIYFVGSSLFE